MVKSSDDLIDRASLKKRLAKWRNISIIALVFLALIIVSRGAHVTPSGGHIAYVSIDGFISEDTDRLDVLRHIRDDNNVKALIVHVDSPGGTIVGGESLYRIIRDIAKKKPVVSTMGSVAASGGYMVAIAANHVIAYQGTITGSIGVLLQTAEITELAKKLGINMITIKTSELKGSPSPFEKITPAISNYLQMGINKAGDIFISMVVESRHLPKEYVKKIADGRIFMGSEAVENHLIDQIGDYEDAIKWLNSSGKISSTLKVRRYDLDADKNSFLKALSLFSGNHNYLSSLNYNGGFVALWNPALTVTK